MLINVNPQTRLVQQSLASVNLGTVFRIVSAGVDSWRPEGPVPTLPGPGTAWLL